MEHKEDGCTQYEGLHNIERAIGRLGILKDVEHILAYVKVPSYNEADHDHSSFYEYILTEVCDLAVGYTSIGAKEWVNSSDARKSAMPQKENCSYPFFTEAIVKKTQATGPLKPFVEYSVCEADNSCVITASAVTLAPGEKKDVPKTEGCVVSLFMPLFSIDAYLSP
ncbi:hypothetical protein AX774_g869 [Zancudomyces culisetae]|uniref:Uncharacterized protein n=1 Tax=Zancudomyces culisetae TaxID=1213189 RepID=A0A1R1PQF3_ZANCU|nr:hypothetical protein AX774_g3290 [Zancudomyces culisetae]OMH85581.1 hypothetical protein AX774_g869 [Zancudomyces culisetae]|eukprot:OMH83215.1 hypothetical protein AX774_g3290 [Zancudomyces culisetae]